jgi:hypothetical protein
LGSLTTVLPPVEALRIGAPNTALLFAVIKVFSLLVSLLKVVAEFVSEELA